MLRCSRWPARPQVIRTGILHRVLQFGNAHGTGRHQGVCPYSRSRQRVRGGAVARFAEVHHQLCPGQAGACRGGDAGRPLDPPSAAQRRGLACVGPIPPNIAQNRFLLPWIIFHAGAAATALLCGPVQLLKPLRRHRPAVHRWLGRVYLAGCMVGGGSGIALAAGVSTGSTAQVGFACLGVLWITVTAQGWHSARVRRWADHERWMVRSFALTCAAVTLRLHIPIAAFGFGFEFNSAYRAISWLAWVPNAIAAELYLKRRRSPFRTPPPFC